jgi:hypothetical protein
MMPLYGVEDETTEAIVMYIGFVQATLSPPARAAQVVTAGD